MCGLQQGMRTCIVVKQKDFVQQTKQFLWSVFSLAIHFWIYFDLQWTSKMPLASPQKMYPCLSWWICKFDFFSTSSYSLFYRSCFIVLFLYWNVELIFHFSYFKILSVDAQLIWNWQGNLFLRWPSYDSVENNNFIQIDRCYILKFSSFLSIGHYSLTSIHVVCICKHTHRIFCASCITFLMYFETHVYRIIVYVATNFQIVLFYYIHP